MANKAVIKGKVSMDGKGVEVGLAKAKQAGRAFKDQLTSIGSAMAGAFAIGSLIRFGNEAINLASTLSDMAFSIGLGTDEFQALSLAARDAGASESQLTNALVKLKVAQGKVIDQDLLMIEAFERLGLTEEKVISLPLPELLKEVADSLTEAENGTVEFTAVAELLGTKNAPKLMEALNRLSEDGYGGLIRQAKAAGQVMSKDTIARMDEAADRIGRFKRTIMVGFGEILAFVTRTSDAITGVLGALTAVGFVETIRQVTTGELSAGMQGKKAGLSTEEKEAKERAGRIAGAAAAKAKTQADKDAREKKKTESLDEKIAKAKLDAQFKQLDAAGKIAQMEERIAKLKVQQNEAATAGQAVRQRELLLQQIALESKLVDLKKKDTTGGAPAAAGAASVSDQLRQIGAGGGPGEDLMRQELALLRNVVQSLTESTEIQTEIANNTAEGGLT